jgi:hypothetical protein
LINVFKPVKHAKKSAQNMTMIIAACVQKLAKNAQMYVPRFLQRKELKLSC